jgi:hypothetical protein
MSWLDDLLTGVRNVAVGGAALPTRETLAFEGTGVSVIDDSINKRTRVIVSSAPGGGGGGPPLDGIGLQSLSSTIVLPVQPAVLAQHAVRLSQLLRHVSPTVLNAQDYGCVGDNVTDNAPFIRAALDACRTTGAGKLFFPAGKYYTSETIDVDIPIEFSGVGSSGWVGDPNSTVFRVPSWTTGLRASKSVNARGANPGADNAIIRNFSLEGGNPTFWLDTAWTSTTSVALAGKVLPTNNRVVQAAYHIRDGNTFEYFYECIQSGTTGATEPEWLNPTIGYFPDRAQAWGAATAFYWGETIRVDGRPSVRFVSVRNTTTSAGAQLFPRVSGITGGTLPGAFATATVGQLITDGTVVWMCVNANSQIVIDGSVIWSRRLAAGIDPQCVATFDNISVWYFANSGIHAQALSNFNNSYVDTNLDPTLPYPQANTNVCSFSRMRVSACGVGITANGADANAMFFYDVNMTLYGGGALSNETRAVGICERSFLGNYYSNVHIAAAGGTYGGSAIYARGAVNSSSFSAVYVEGDCGPTAIYGNSIGIGAGGFKGTLREDSFFTGNVGVNDWRGLGAKATSPAGKALGFQFRPEPTTLFSWEQDSSEASGAYRLVYDAAWGGRGWWSLSYANARTSILFSNQRAEEGYGNVRFNNGFVEGTESDKRIFFASDSGRNDQFIRLSRRNVGDHSRANSWSTRGGYADRVVTVAGYQANAVWSAFSSRTAPWPYGNFASGGDANSPTTPNGYTYVCAKAGTTGATEPTWPTAIGPYAPVFNPSVGLPLKVGAYVRSSTLDGTIYQITALAGFITDDVQPIFSEPIWTTGAGGIGTSFLDPTTGATFLRAQADSSSYYVTDGTVIWMTQIKAKWERSGFVASEAEATTTNATPAVIESYPELSLNSARRYRARVVAHNRTTNEAKSLIVEALVARGAGSAAVIGSASSTSEEASAALATATATFVLSGNAVTIQVTGVAATSLVWTTEILPA